MTGRFAHARPWQVVIGDRDVTPLVATCTYSNVDPGGFEACSISLADPAEAPRAGDRVTVRYGLEVAWDGRVNDPGNASKGDTIVESIQAVGYGSALKDTTMRLIGRDVDLSRWRGASTKRRIDLTSAGVTPHDPTVQTDAQTAKPALVQAFRGDWAAGGLPGSEAWYDAQGIAIAKLAYAWRIGSANVSSADTNWSWVVYLASADDASGTLDNTGNLRAPGPGSGTLVASTNRDWALVQFSYGVAAGNANHEYAVHWTSLAVYGDHGLTVRGAEPDAGLYPTDVALHVLADANDGQGVSIDRGPVDVDGDAYAVRQCVYFSETPHEQIIDDMVRKHLGWHWGVWEPSGLHSTAPRLFMTKPPEEATAYIARADLGDGFDAPRVRADQLYDVAAVRYADVAGREGYAYPTVRNPLLDQSGIGSRTLVMDAGISTAAAAATLGEFALALSQTSARGAGTATVPETVGTAQGRGPACLLKSGRDRLRITDLPDPGPLHEPDTRRFDTFHIRRVETTIDGQGVPQTRVELGSGADLMEVLQARQAAALVNVG